MLDEIEFEQFNKIYIQCVNNVKLYREKYKVTLNDVPLNELYQPSIEIFEELTGEKVICDFNHLPKHRISLYGELCKKCNKPLRTPQAKICANCENKV